MKLYGLIGYPLSHSFSKKYFTEKFEKEGITNSKYELFEIDNIEKLSQVLAENPNLKGLNVTIPYKQVVIPFLDELDPSAERIGAVNVIKLENEKLKGYNSDYYGFKNSLETFLNGVKPKAVILGTGGASKAVEQALKDLDIECQYVSRTRKDGVLDYEELKVRFTEFKLIINSSPLGMYPKVDSCPDLPYEKMDSTYFLYDLVYNPEETLFMKKGREKGAKAIHGMEMLIGQAEKAWEIWNKES
jgi:shikimate dehydrogenase